jgi:HAD superfamily hydrolase (TIGR01509 family)
MPNPKAVLWDMDGVLADTSQFHFQSWEFVLSEEGIPFDRRQFHLIYGLKSSDFINHLVGKPLEPGRIKRIADQKEHAYRQLIRGSIQPLPGVLDWLRRFKSWGWRQAVASSAQLENIDALVDELNIRDYFDALVGPGDLPGKPDPAVFLKAARALNVPIDRCIVIEDSIPGVEAACRAGMHTIAVANTNPPEALTRADLVVVSLDQLSLDQVESLF